MAKLIDASDVLKRLIAAHDLTQAEVADAARVTPVTANRWVNGKQRADSETIARAIRRLGDDPAEYGITLRRPLDGDDGDGDIRDWLRAELVAAEALAERRHAEVMQALEDLVHTLGAQGERGR